MSQVLFVAVTGFLGAGKTTTIGALGTALEARGHRVAIVTNDQGEGLVDTRLAASSGGRVAEVTGGCFCCRFDDLLAVLTPLVERDRCDVILAEAVGSCTDLQATVVRPMRQLYGDRFQVAPLLTVLDPARLTDLTAGLLAGTGPGDDDLAYLFERQLAEADIIAVNKSDTGDPSAHRSLTAALTRTYPTAQVLPLSARTTTGLEALLDALATPSPPRPLDLDYDRYARAEADLAWLNLTLHLDHSPQVARRVGDHSPQPAPPYDETAAAWIRAALATLSDRAEREDWVIGHAKVLVEDEQRTLLAKGSLTAAGTAPTLDPAGAGDRAVRAFVNARIACSPEQLDHVVQDAVAIADAATGIRSTPTAPAAAFRPGYPEPVHRMPVA